jgi:hypothetical protein
MEMLLNLIEKLVKEKNMVVIGLITQRRLVAR